MDLYALGQVFLAAILGLVLGFQRERSGKSAGPRTYALVTAGSALFTLLAVNFMPGSPNSVNIIAQIVTGIGFLGAGMILKRENHVEGLTTAAGLWMTAAIGVTTGLGLNLLAIAVTVLIFVLFMLDDSHFRRRPPEE